MSALRVYAHGVRRSDIPPAATPSVAIFVSINAADSRRINPDSIREFLQEPAMTPLCLKQPKFAGFVRSTEIE